jgi:hypothetical protein
MNSHDTVICHDTWVEPKPNPLYVPPKRVKKVVIGAADGARMVLRPIDIPQSVWATALPDDDPRCVKDDDDLAFLSKSIRGKHERYIYFMLNRDGSITKVFLIIDGETITNIGSYALTTHTSRMLRRGILRFPGDA